jgi:hypothetical protein
MSVGHRIFIVEEDAIYALSQKAFNAMHSGTAGILPKYAGQTILIAVILYTLQERKPKAIIQIDCERVRILDDGSIDMGHEQDGLHLAANRISLPETKPRSAGRVVDATARLKKGNGTHAIRNCQGSLIGGYWMHCLNRSLPYEINRSIRRMRAHDIEAREILPRTMWPEIRRRPVPRTQPAMPCSTGGGGYIGRQHRSCCFLLELF